MDKVNVFGNSPNNNEQLLRIQQKLLFFRKAFLTLEETLTYDVNHPLLSDATIQRFEYTYELSWNVIKELLSFYGVPVVSPRESFKEALQFNWIIDHDLWFNMLIDRNKTSHVYRETIADSVYKRVRSEYIAAFKGLCLKLEEVLANELKTP